MSNPTSSTVPLPRRTFPSLVSPWVPSSTDLLVLGDRTQVPLVLGDTTQVPFVHRISNLYEQKSFIVVVLSPPGLSSKGHRKIEI